MSWTIIVQRPTNQQDDLNMADSAYRQKMVEGIVSGVNEYYQQ